MPRIIFLAFSHFLVMRCKKAGDLKWTHIACSGFSRETPNERFIHRTNQFKCYFPFTSFFFHWIKNTYSKHPAAFREIEIHFQIFSKHFFDASSKNKRQLIAYTYRMDRGILCVYLRMCRKCVNSHNSVFYGQVFEFKQTLYVTFLTNHSVKLYRYWKYIYQAEMASYSPTQQWWNSVRDINFINTSRSSRRSQNK